MSTIQYWWCCVALVTTLLPLATTVGARQPNILLIVADDLGWNDVGYHGSEIQTPNLDRLAGEGVKLENYYVQPICTPTRSQLLSGRYQIHTGLQHYVILPGRPYGLPLSDPTIADELKKLGYATHIVGKWHLGQYKWEYTPTYRGFDTHYGYYSGAEDYYLHVQCANHTDCGYDFRDQKDVDWSANNTYSAFLFANRAENIVKQHAETTPDKPMFLYLALQSVHLPLQVPPQYLEKYNFIHDKDRRTYAAMTSVLDEAIGNVTSSFQHYGLWNNTIVIVSTDNGGDQIESVGNNWPLLGGKHTLWEGGMRGVGFVSGPLLPHKGVISTHFMHVSDWFPTLLHLAGGTGEKLQLDGYNMWESISTGSASRRTELLHNIDPLYPVRGHRLYNDTFDTRVRAAIRWKNWKLITGDPGIKNRGPPPQSGSKDTNSILQDTEPPNKNLWLFDINQDPLEAVELSVKEPGIVKFLLNKLLAYNSTAVPVMYPPFDPNSVPGKHGGVWGPWID